MLARRGNLHNAEVAASLAMTVAVGDPESNRYVSSSGHSFRVRFAL
jgi:hypothetical protein